jgi:hypothetical protein
LHSWAVHRGDGTYSSATGEPLVKSWFSSTPAHPFRGNTVMAPCIPMWPEIAVRFYPPLHVLVKHKTVPEGCKSKLLKISNKMIEFSKRVNFCLYITGTK